MCRSEQQLKSCVDGNVVAVCANDAASADDIERALEAAARVHKDGTWRKSPAKERMQVLCKVFDALTPEVTDAMARVDAEETGVPISVTQDIDGSLKDFFTADALEPLCDAASPTPLRTAHGAMKLARRPHGPALILAPWNVPTDTVVGKVIAALMAGCPVIVKPSEVAPTGLGIFLTAMLKAGFPHGVLQWLHGGAKTGAALVNDARVRAVHFTGSTVVGRQIAEACAKRFVPLLMECGGSNVAIVLNDADLDVAAEGITRGLTLLNGQWCAGVSRVLVHTALHDALVAKIIENVSKLKVGRAEDDSTEFGPLSHYGHLQRMNTLFSGLLGQGGKAHQVPNFIDNQHGFFFSPTLVTGLPADVQRDEMFGPIATVHTFTEPCEAIDVANSQSQLQSYIFSSDTEGAFELGSDLECGSVMVNAVDYGFDGTVTMDGTPQEPTLSFFKSSGLGTEAGSAATVHFFAGAQSIGVNA